MTYRRSEASEGVRSRRAHYTDVLGVRVLPNTHINRRACARSPSYRFDFRHCRQAPDPVPLSNRYKLVMSPHSYGPSLYDVPELLQYFPERFLEPTYPANLRAYWEENWGFLQGKGLPLLISEMGGNMACCDIPGVFENPDADRLYQEELVRYLGEMGVGLFYFTLNPGSHDTGGVLEADWKTSNEMKLNLLSRVKATRVLP